MFKTVPRIGTCDAGFSSSKFRSSCLPFVVKQTTLLVFSQLLLSRTTVDSNFFHGPNKFEIMRVNCISFRIKLEYSVLNPKAPPYSLVCLLFLKEHFKQIINCLDLHCCEKMYRMQKTLGFSMIMVSKKVLSG